MLMGAGLGAGTAMLTGNDPLKGAAMGGVAGGIGGNAMTTNPLSSGAGGMGGAVMSNAPAHLAQTGAQQAASNFASQGLMGQMGDMVSGVGDIASNAMDGFTDMTGMTGQDLGGMAVNEGVNALSQPPQNAPNFNVPQAGISRPQFQPGMQGGGMLASNPLMRKRQGLL